MNRLAAAALSLFFGTTAMAQPELPPLPPEVLRAMEEHNNRKKYSDFDLSTLREIKDEHLEQAILDYLFAKLDAKPNQARYVLAGLAKGFQVFYASWLVEAEVMNGGFNQYFWNSSSEFAELTPAALTEIGDPVAAEMVQHALSIAVAEIPSMSMYKRSGTLQAFSESYKHTKLSDLDAPFCKRAEDFPALRIRYVREHPRLFVTR